MVSYTEGATLKAVNQKYLEEIQSFDSFKAMEIFVKRGDTVRKTVDCFTFIGNVRLIHSDSEVVQRDTDRMREIEHAEDFLLLE